MPLQESTPGADAIDDDGDRYDHQGACKADEDHTLGKPRTRVPFPHILTCARAHLEKVIDD